MEQNNKNLQKLQQKIQLKKNNRSKKNQILNFDNIDIYDNVRLLMIDVQKIQALHMNELNPVQVAQTLKWKYNWLYKNYFMIYRATCFNEMELKMLRIMLDEKEKIDSKKSSLEDSSQVISNVLVKKFNIDVEAMEKGILEEQAKKGINDQSKK